VEAFLKILILWVSVFLDDGSLFLKANFSSDKYFFQRIKTKNKKLTDIGFLLVFPGLKELVFFLGFGPERWGND